MKQLATGVKSVSIMKQLATEVKSVSIMKQLVSKRLSNSLILKGKVNIKSALVEIDTQFLN